MAQAVAVLKNMEKIVSTLLKKTKRCGWGMDLKGVTYGRVARPEVVDHERALVLPLGGLRHDGGPPLPHHNVLPGVGPEAQLVLSIPLLTNLPPPLQG